MILGRLRGVRVKVVVSAGCTRCRMMEVGEDGWSSWNFLVQQEWVMGDK